ncbi:precorrin-3B C(17)-methyltransferase [Pseudobacteriovorax antillogorgiicola]|uniref:Uncharacterized protein n=1 Tax=Pseudobacteriovorax antillogorgiicola TaxID=1513793 RepID=A0A1Y6C6U1_9BACT|nr:precorrin-3B C(17)-methyltransferase [Pseudobacteriovorax antillogorgiicola]TCS50679.1 hypothetical protein EDD56_11262 [Pseudobacteriovorax antillogorgiicola]SMF40108.1 hypothetical protein SAMN06296036_11261 [Pseudobacteriovorax antillogorgiicola]
MALIGRIAGAILLRTEEKSYLIGDLKEPCSFEDRGFHPPLERDVIKHPFVEIQTNGKDVICDDDYELVVTEDSSLPSKIVDRFLIFRNGSISERLWGLVTESSEAEGKRVNAEWLMQTPDDVWEIVRDSVLRC